MASRPDTNHGARPPSWTLPNKRRLLYSSPASVSVRSFCPAYQVASTVTAVSSTVAVVGPATVLTAAHCVFNARTRRNFLPSSLHVLIGYDRGRWSAHARVTDIQAGLDYDPTQAAENRGGDWALLTIESVDAARDRILPLPPLAAAEVVYWHSDYI